MSAMICRLCLNDTKLIDIFDARLTNSEQLRKCILLGTGVQICRNDVVTKYICEYCSDIAIYLYKYRKKALANDKALKELAKQRFVEPPTETEDIVKINDAIVNQLKTEEEENSSGPKNHFIKKPEECRKVAGVSLAVHPTVIQLIKTFPKLKIPNEILKYDIQPKLVLDENEVKRWKPPTKLTNVEANNEISYVERFKLKCPGISIMKISQAAENISNNVENTNVEISNSTLMKRKLSESFSDVLKKRKSNEDESLENDTKVKSSKKPAPIKYTENFKIPLRKPSLEESSSKKESSIVIAPTEPESIRNHSDISKPCTNTAAATLEKNTPTLCPPFHIQKSNCKDKLEKLQNIENESEKIIPKRLHKRTLFLTDSEQSDNESIGADDATENLLDTVIEQISLHCGHCNKIFDSRQKLKNHERAHRNCCICKAIFGSAEALRTHQKELCYKNIITNSPNLQLIRVDEQPEIVKLYPKTFKSSENNANVNKRKENRDEILCISDDDDVEFVDNTSNDIDNYVHNNQEFQHVCAVFRKYKDVKFPMITKPQYTETKPQIYVKYNQKNQIVLENMYPELKSYRVPVELFAKPSSFAYISFTKKSEETKDIYCWANEPVISLSTKKALNKQVPQNRDSNSTNTLSGSAINEVRQFPQNRDSNSTNTLSVSAINEVRQFQCNSFQLMPSSNQNTASQRITDGKLRPIAPAINKATNLGQNSILLSYIHNTKPIQEKNFSMNTSDVVSSALRDGDCNASVNNSVQKPQVQEPIPSTSGISQHISAQPSKEGSIGLRVKTPWELNKL